jgi:tRNA (guanosine-2'-O-)-methyltransferase
VREVSVTGLSNAETCFNAIDDNQNLLIDEGCGVDQGQIQFVIAWPEPEADVDLYVTDPDGEIAPVDGATQLGLVRSLDCPDEKNICSGQNYENVYLEEDDPPPGTYRVRVRVERIPEGVKVLEVSMGVRLPTATIANEILLHAEGQEVVLSFSVAGDEDKD